ncbi:MAG: DUF4270 family protein [Bacteroidota bacterium]
MKKTIFKSLNYALGILGLFFLLNTSCNDPQLVGADVIDPDRADVVFTDTLSIFASSIKDDSVRTYNSLNLLNIFLCGKLDDPIFGESESIINTQLRLTGTPDSTLWAGINGISGGETKLDSVVFVLEYDTASFFGPLNSTYDISVHALAEDMNNNETYYSDINFDVDPIPLASATINPAAFDTTFSVPAANGDTIFPPQLRLSVDRSHPLIQDFLFSGDLSYYQNDTSLLPVFRGVQVRVDGSPDASTMMAFRLNSQLSGLYLYYHNAQQEDTLRYRFAVNSNAAQMVHFPKPDYAGSIVEPFIDDEANGENLIFIQGMSGLNAKFRIPYAENLQNAIVNQAQLELTIATILPDDKQAYFDDPLPQLLISKKNPDDDDLIIISDLEAALSVSSLTGVFGGNLTEVVKDNVIYRQYKMNVTDHLQDMINGVEESDEIFITAISKAQTAQRSIIFGPKNSTFPIKLNVTYTINQ